MFQKHAFSGAGILAQLSLTSWVDHWSSLHQPRHKVPGSNLAHSFQGVKGYGCVVSN